MNAQRLAKMLSNAWHITRTSNTRVMYRCAHLMIADGLLSITATDGFRLLRQAEPLNSPDAMFAVDLDEMRLQTLAAREGFGAQRPDVAAIEAEQDDVACVTLSAAGETRRVRIPIAAPPSSERSAWARVYVHGIPERDVQWASITDGRFASKAVAALKKDDRCYLHMDAGWLNVWRHTETRVSAVTTLERSSYTERIVVLTAPAPDAVATRVRVNPQWLQQALRLFPQTAEIGLTPASVVIADRREAPRTVIVIAAMRPERGDA